MPPIIRHTLSAFALLATILHSAAFAQEKAQPTNPLAGTWIVQTVELAGLAIPGFKGSKLVLAADGKKTFTLPSGTVEQGTYTLDAKKSPPHVDSTTEGKPGTQRGIYSLEGDTLKLCLATADPRPTKLATARGSDALLITLSRSAAKPEPAPAAATIPATKPSNAQPPAAKPNGTRPFRMGFTGFVHDITLPAVTASRKFVRENGDILAHHIEGVPWSEALSGQPFPKPVLESWEGKKLATPKNGQVYLAISPGRGELKIQDKAGPLPKELAGKEYDDPLVMQAYLAYCRGAIEFFQPDYLAIGIEVNEIHRDGGEKKWNAYVALHEHVYRELKKEHKNLPIFASCTLHSMFQKRGGMLAAFQKLMPHNDLVAVSYYPFFVPEQDRYTAFDWLTQNFDQFQKPYAMVETNDSAEKLPLPSLKITLPGTPETQADYYRHLLALAQQRKFAFVISFIHQDYDALWEKIKGSSPELFKAWRDCGLLDESGKPRPALKVWQDYLALPLSSP